MSRATRLNGRLGQKDAAAGYVALTSLGVANGPATLDGTGKLTAAQVPAITLNNTWPVASQAAMLALSTAQVGDIAIRSDVPSDYVLSALPAATLGNWLALAGVGVSSVAGRSGSVSLSTSDISGLGTAAQQPSTAFDAAGAAVGMALVFGG